ncbi:DNA translocase FtsK [Mesorhizobium sp. M8A.F.Ca.ET.057.01.1.1]|uniref:DNA translocase FtsK n=2 Tax=unclassified Mesorhizobium TaxID=325217 RepID=UPI000F758B3E|nr:DNA translocase FtsK [Mesorhizobium sp. M8A.F.Ca.ET.057.01.1.1]AZO52238.1 DNA translocase FtsK [Mesorhizobium sp. M8A.F.Ca.ET.057.01.1.1]
MEARRFSRVNSLHAVSPDDPQGERSGGPRGKADVGQSGASHAGHSGRVADLGGDTESPAWQEYFFLAPNVRFTRTPDYEPKHRQQHDEVAGEGRPQALPTQQAGPGAVMHRGPSPAGSAQPARGGETSQGVVPAAPKVPATAVATRPAPVVRNGAPVNAATAEKARRPYLSDHAFFEGLAPLLVDVTSPVRQVSPAPRAPVAAPPVAAARADISASAAADVTALFRVIECLPGQAPSAPPDVFPANSNKAVAEPSVPARRTARQARMTTAVAPAASNAAPTPIAQRVGEAVPAARAPSLPMAGKVAQPETGEGYELPSEELLQQPPEGQGFYMSQERLEQNADLLESVLEDFGVRGEIIHVRPGPVVTLYEFEPAPGVKSSRVIGLADDIARSMSAVSARVAVVPGRNVIGIELPNETRETVYFRELIESQGFRKTSCKLALCLGKTIGGEPVIAELAKMPHLLVAGTTGSGKSVAINTMILSLLYRLKPEECRLIMVDPKMLELSVYDGIPHLLTPVVTDPKKAVTALKWAVREMEDRYRKMARLGVRNIDGYNERAAQARDKGETVVMSVQAGFEKGTGEPLFEQQEIDLAPMPYIVVIVDEMADLMMVAGKEIEGAIQRLAQMARAAGIHLIMATQRPSVDVITGTIKANFPTRISFQVTSKIDSRTILGEQGAEQLLGQGDMLHMMGGGRIARVHGPFVSDAEVEHVVAHLKAQGRPEYLETVTADEDEEEEEGDQGAVFDKGAVAAEDGDSSYDEAVKVVLRDKKCSTSYIQRRLGIGYNRAASLVERMEKEGLVGAPNHVGKREIMAGKRQLAAAPADDDAD